MWVTVVHPLECYFWAAVSFEEGCGCYGELHLSALKILVLLNFYKENIQELELLQRAFVS